MNAIRVKPKPRKNNILAFITGLMIPVILIILIDTFNNKIIDKKDIEKLTSIPIVGYISHNSYTSEIPVKDMPRSTLSESFRSIRTSIKYLIREERNPVIAITSTISSEGKTFISINLAAIIAQLGKKVLLVGLDLRKPRIHNVLGVSNDTGLSSYLIGENSLDDIIMESGTENLYFIPSGPVPPNPSELIDSEKMETFFAEVKKRFDFVIIDTPPLAIVTDTLLLSRWLDITMFVVRQRFSSRHTIDLINDLCINGRLKNPGIIINDINLSGYYGYGVRYGYTLGYGYNYGYGYYGKYSLKRYSNINSGEGYYLDDSL